MIETVCGAERASAISLGERLRDLRVRRGMRQEALAHAADISPSYLSRIESGQREPSPPLLADMARILGASVDFIVTGIDEQRASSVRLALRQAEYKLGAGEPEQADVEFGALLEAAREAGDPYLVAQTLFGKAAALEAMGRLHDAIAWLEPLRTSSQPGGEHWVRAVISLLRCYRESGDLAHAVDLGESALGVLADLGLQDTHDGIRVAVTLLSAYFERGDVARAVYLAEDSVARAERAGNPETLAAAYWNASQLTAHRGDVADALTYAERAVALQGEGENARLLGRARLAYANVLLRQEDPDVPAVLALLDRADEALRDGVGTAVDLGHVAVERARAFLAMGELDLANRSADRALDLFGTEPNLYAAMAHFVHGRAAAIGGDPDRALFAYRQAVIVLTSADAGRRAAQLWTDLGAFFDEAGEAEHARDSYRAAAACLGVIPAPQPRTRAPDNVSLDTRKLTV